MLDFSLLQDGIRIFPGIVAQDVRFGKSRQGMTSATAFYPARLEDGLRYVNRAGLTEAVVTNHTGRVIWRGRVEDIGAESGGVGVTAFGYARAFSDVPYTALWSKATSANFSEVTEEELATSTPARYRMNANNRVYIAQQKNHESGNDARGVMGFRLPHLGERNAATISVAYDIAAQGGLEYILRVNGYTEGGTFVDGNFIATTTSADGTLSHTFGAAVQWIQIHWHRNNATASTYAGETGEEARAICTSIRIKSTTAAEVYASAIAAALRAYVTAQNAGQIVVTDALIQATTADILEAIYEDRYPADILDELAGNDYVWGVDELRQFFFKPRSTAGRQWFVELADIILPYSLDKIINSSYATYRNEGGRRTMRTATASNATSVQSFGVTRRRVVNAPTTSDAAAVVTRDAYIAAQLDRAVMASISAGMIINAAGQLRPSYELEPGDTLTVRNAPVSSQFVADSFSFVVERTEYDVNSGIMRFEPADPTPTLANLIAG